MAFLYTDGEGSSKEVKLGEQNLWEKGGNTVVATLTRKRGKDLMWMGGAALSQVQGSDRQGNRRKTGVCKPRYWWMDSWEHKEAPSVLGSLSLWKVSYEWQ